MFQQTKNRKVLEFIGSTNSKANWNREELTAINVDQGSNAHYINQSCSRYQTMISEYFKIMHTEGGKYLKIKH